MCNRLRGKVVAGVYIPEGSTHSFRRAWGSGVGRDTPDRDLLIRGRNKRARRATAQRGKTRGEEKSDFSSA